jgi:hypothetical protein
MAVGYYFIFDSGDLLGSNKKQGLLSNLLRTTPFWNNLHQVRSKQNDLKTK